MESCARWRSWMVIWKGIQQTSPSCNNCTPQLSSLKNISQPGSAVCCSRPGLVNWIKAPISPCHLCLWQRCIIIFSFFHLRVVWRTVDNHSEPSNWFPRAPDLLIHMQAYLSIYKAPQHGHGLCTPSSSCTSFQYELTGQPQPRLWFGTQDTSVGR